MVLTLWSLHNHCSPLTITYTLRSVIYAGNQPGRSWDSGSLAFHLVYLLGFLFAPPSSLGREAPLLACYVLLMLSHSSVGVFLLLLCVRWLSDQLVEFIGNVPY